MPSTGGISVAEPVCLGRFRLRLLVQKSHLDTDIFFNFYSPQNKQKAACNTERYIHFVCDNLFLFTTVGLRGKCMPKKR